MAKIASTRAYGRPGSKDTEDESAKNEDVRVSPRRRTAPQFAETRGEMGGKAAKSSKTKTKLPIAPLFSEERRQKRRKSKVGNEEGKEKELGDEESLKEQEAIMKPSSKQEAIEEVPVSPRRSPRRKSVPMEEVEDEVEGVEQEYIEETEELVGANEHEEIEGTREIYESQVSEPLLADFEAYVNSPIFVGELAIPKEFEENSPFNDNRSGSFLHGPSEIDDEEEDVEEDDDDSMTSSSSSAIEYNAQFVRESASTIRARLQEYFRRRGRSDRLASFNHQKAHVWSWVKDFVGRGLMEKARELGEVTINLTKRAVEQLTTPRPQTDADSSEEEDFVDSSEHVDVVPEFKKSKIEECERIDGEKERLGANFVEEAIESGGRIHEPSYETVSSSNAAVFSSAIEARLTELLLQFARASRVNCSSPRIIYENLSEFFDLKGGKELNFAEKQLVMTVMKECLLESASEADEYDLGFRGGVGSVFSYSSNVSTPLPATSPSKIKTLPVSGVRFRAPQFTPEEESRLEALEVQRQQQKQCGSVQRKVPPSTRGKKYLLPCSRTMEILETIGSSEASHGSLKACETRSAVEELISQRTRDAQARLASQKAETEELKARVAELERERSERHLKEKLLDQQRPHQQHPVKTEGKFEFGAPISVLNEKPAAATVKVPEAKSLGVGSGSSTTPLVPVKLAGTGLNGSGFSGFAFGSKPAAGTAAKPATDMTVKPAAEGSAKPFSFGGDSGGKPLNAAGSLTFGSGPLTSDATTALKPFTFNSDTSTRPISATTEPISKPFSFGTEPSKPLSFESGPSKPSAFTAEPLAAKPFTFGSVPVASEESTAKREETVPSKVAGFSFGGSDGTNKAPAFTFGAAAESETSQPKRTAFSFGAAPDQFGNAGASAIGSSTTGAAFGSLSAPSNPSNTATAASGNPFGNLNAPGLNASNPFGGNVSNPLGTPFGFNSSNPFAANTGHNGAASPFSFTPTPTATAGFAFPAADSSFGASAAIPIVPMTFGGGALGSSGDSANGATGGAFDIGNRQISVPKRRLRR